MDARNIVAHTITADSAWQAFQYLTGEEERVYGLLFKKFFGWDMAQWESVSKEQKEKTLENCKWSTFLLHKTLHSMYWLLWLLNRPRRAPLPLGILGDSERRPWCLTGKKHACAFSFMYLFTVLLTLLMLSLLYCKSSLGGLSQWHWEFDTFSCYGLLGVCTPLQLNWKDWRDIGKIEFVVGWFQGQ